MNTFNLHKEITEDYKSYIHSFINIKDERIRKVVDEGFGSESIIPEPLIQFNPAYEKGCKLRSLIEENIVHEDLDRIFSGFELYKHQEQAIRIGAKDEGFIVTSGTGSGKSLTFLATIFNHILKNPKKDGVKAIIVYPMNALINSQKEEIHKYAINYLSSFLRPGESWDKEKLLEVQIKELEKKTQKKFPIKYARYTGQESSDEKAEVRKSNPDIILTNYVMLELIMTRFDESSIRKGMRDSMQYLVFDELHTYRGRQGADVSMLIRRINAFCKNELTIIGTSATMASGLIAEKKQIIADFVSTIFGKTYLTDQIITETLVFSTDQSTIVTAEKLKVAVNQKVEFNNSETLFTTHPLAVWLEKEIALVKHEDQSIERGFPLTMNQMIDKLAEFIDENLAVCKDALYDLLLWGEQLNIAAIARKERKSFLPFKIHQFISQTGTVYVTLENPNDRHISLKEERYLKRGDKDEFLFPLLFSRYSGHDFMCVELDHSTNKIKPRLTDELNERITQGDYKDLKRAGLTPTIETLNKGYIIFETDNEVLWDESLIENLPGSYYERSKSKGTLKVHDYHALFLPHRIYFDSKGRFSLTSESNFEMAAWYMPTGILLDPTAGVIYDSRTSENTKLMRLGNEGRSTATTMTTISVLRALQNQGEERRKQKLLSFTDNRQDASLQAGHFNHFISIVRLRSAMYHALKEAPGNVLTVTDIAQRVKKQLRLREIEFARTPAPEENIPNQKNQEALEKYIFLLIMNDLKRGWRYILPNLELCGLLNFNYSDFDNLVKNEEIWQDDLLLSHLDISQRQDLLEQILNYFRQGYAIDHRFFDRDEIELNQKIMRDTLDAEKVWSLDKNDKIEKPFALFTRQIPERLKRTVFYSSAGTRSNLGKYCKQKIKEITGQLLASDDLELYINSLLTKLSRHNFLICRNYTQDGTTYSGYQLNCQKLNWSLGDGKKIFRDEINNSYYKNFEIKPNIFFQEFYKQDFTKYQANLEAREHTGQIDKEIRMNREGDFRQGDIAALFCSPTMELGIDIAELNVVHLRNVPPSPANYAQRSGRAGRSGQTALIINYCSLGSPHDRHYFNNSIDMVAGVVSAPKIDLANKDLLHAHINAYIFMEMGIEQIRESANDILQVTNDQGEYPIEVDIAANISNLISINKNNYFTNIKSFLNANYNELSEQDWFNDAWIMHCIEQFLPNLDKAFDRWRLLFRNAIKQRIESQKIKDDFTIKENHDIKKEARRTNFNAQRQITLLLVDPSLKSKDNSEFYVFRYLASEGFFPGYNFVRLPIRTYLGQSTDKKGTYVSRPRFIALREFGPQNIIYHNGNKYQVKKLMLANSQFEENKRKIKVCVESHYAYLDDTGDAINNDPITNNPLDTSHRVWLYNDMIEVAETIAEPQDRISSQEEERVRLGYKTELYFNFPEGIDKAKKTTISNEESELLKIWFYKAASLIEVNHKWRASRDDGFMINKQFGNFEQLRNINDDNRAQFDRVRLFTTDTSDMLLVQPVSVLNLNEGAVVSLAFALKRAVERLFQVEENEIGVNLIGSDNKNILIYEAAEGSLGVLSQIAYDSRLMKSLFVEAYKVCHFDPVSRQDTKADEIGAASYQDLLSYSNQIHHDVLNRHSIKDALEVLMDSVADNTRYFDSRKENLDYLYKNYDKLSQMEKDFIDGLKKYECKLPDKAQVSLSNIAHTYASADFLYQDEKVLVFIDGNVHDRPDVANADSVKRKALFHAGFTVLVWNYREPLNDFLKANTHIFKCKNLK